MALPRIKFAWKPTISGREQWRWGLWMPVYGKSGRLRNYKIMVRGVLLWLSGIALFCYLALTTAWFVILNRHPGNLVTWTDCVLAPVRWDDIRVKRGDAYIAEGLAAMEAQKWSEAVLKIEAGLARSPNNRNGRRQLGLFYILAGQRERGLKLLAAGFERFFPGREDTELFLRVALEGESFDDALMVLSRCMAQKGSAVEREYWWLADQKTRVLVTAERYREVLGWIGEQTVVSEVMWESKVVALIELTRFTEARAALEEWEAANGLTNAVQRIRVRLAREERNLDEMRGVLKAMRSIEPRNPQPWVYEVIQEHLAEQTVAAKEALDAFLLRFGGTADNLLLVARPLAEIKAWSLFAVVETRFDELQLRSSDFNKLRAEAAVMRGDLELARTSLKKLQDDEVGTSSPGQIRWRETMRSLVEYLISGEEATRAQVIETVSRVPFALKTLQQFVELSETSQQEELALQILDIAHRRFPASVATNRAYQQLKGVLGDRAVPEVEIPLVQDGDRIDLESEIRSIVAKDDAPLGVLSSKQFLAQSSAMISREQWSELSSLLRELRRARPEWANGFRKEINEREMALNIAQQNWPALVGNVRFLLDGSVPRALEVMGIVRELELKRERAAAEMVLIEVERRHKDFPPARRTREDWAEEARRDEANAKVEEALAKPAPPSR